MHVPDLTTRQMIEVDRLMVEEYGIQLIQMMENAGRNLAALARQMVGGDVRSKRIAVLCGAGNNGGGGLVAARHLHNWGAEVLVSLVATQDQFKSVPAHQLAILKKMGIPHTPIIDLNKADLIIDALIGYGLRGDPRGKTAHWIRQVNDAGRSVLALDTPSGLDVSTGIPGDPCIRATATLTLALPKSGLRTPQALPLVGQLYLADIGVPPQLYAAPTLGLAVGPLFAQNTILHLEN